MTPGEMKFINWALLLLGSGLVFSGWRTIRKRRTVAEGREYIGRAAVNLGWLWVVIGAVLVIAVVFNVAILKNFGRLFMEATP
jgi:hypothetical protein